MAISHNVISSPRRAGQSTAVPAFCSGTENSSPYPTAWAVNPMHYDYCSGTDICHAGGLRDLQFQISCELKPNAFQKEF